MTKNTTLSLVSLSSTLDVGDVLSVVTSRAESRFHTELSEAKKRLSEAEKTAKRLDKEATELYKAECKAAADAVAKKLRPAVESVGGKVFVNQKVFVHQNVFVNQKDSYRIERRERNDEGKLTQSVTVKNNTGGYNSDCQFTATAEPSEALVALEASVEAAKEDVTKRQAEALGWRKKLANVPLLERRARAKLAEAKLAESEDGQKVLDLLTDDLEAEFLALPSN